MVALLCNTLCDLGVSADTADDFPMRELFLACVMSYAACTWCKLCVTTISSLQPSNLMAAQSSGVENAHDRQLHPPNAVGRKTSKRKIRAIANKIVLVI